MSRLTMKRIPRKTKKRMKAMMAKGDFSLFQKMMARMMRVSTENTERMKRCFKPLDTLPGGVVAHGSVSGEAVINPKEIERLRAELSYKPSVTFEVDSRDFMARIDGLKVDIFNMGVKKPQGI